MALNLGRRAQTAALITAAIGSGGTHLLADTFHPGDIVVYRVGDGSTPLIDASAPVFLDEYSPTGTLVQSIPLPTTASGANRALTATGNSSSEGMLNLSADGRYLLLGGYDAPVGTAGPENADSTAINRVVGRVNAAGSVNTSTVLSYAFAGNNIRSVASTNGTDLWVSGTSASGTTSGIYYTTAGSSTGTNVVPYATRDVAIYAGQLYAGTTSKTSPTIIASIGTGIPTSAAAAAALPGLPSGNTGSTNQFVLLDLSPAVPGPDTLYVADDTGTALTKYSLVGGSWTSNGHIGKGGDDYDGLTATLAPDGTVTLFATRLNGGIGATLVSLSDPTGYNGAFAPTPTILATASTNQSFLGIALAPTSLPEPSTLGLLLITTSTLLTRRQKPRNST